MNRRRRAWVASVGGKREPPWAIGLNTLVTTTHASYVRDFTGFDRPWARLGQYLPNLRVQEIEWAAATWPSARLHLQMSRSRPDTSAAQRHHIFLTRQAYFTESILARFARSDET
jgi:hypothetical protein